MWWTFFILFFLISVVSSTILFFSLRRINQYENLIVEIEQIIKFASEKMKQVDANGHYESDDETGFFFEQLKSVQVMLGEIFVEDTDSIKSEPVIVKGENKNG